LSALPWVDALEAELLGAGRWSDPLALGQHLDPPRTDAKGRRAGVRRSPALDIVCRELVDLANLANDRLMVFVPPQEGKSTTVAQWFPLWLLARDPSLKIAVMSHSARLARKRGKWVRQQCAKHPELGVELVRGSAAAEDWQTAAGGGMRSVGIEGGITGDPVDVLIMDDPVRGRAEAESKTYREAAWDWWENNGSTRASDRFAAVLIMTRWHTDDLAGRLQKEEPGDWRVVSIPAIAEPDDLDPLGRQPGEELPSVQDRPKGWFHRLAKLRSKYVWLSIFQQRPTAAQGNLFLRESWRYWERARHPDYGESISMDGRLWPVKDCYRFITADLATSTKTSADFTVFSAWAIPGTGDLVLLDRFRDRVAEADHFEKARPLVERWQIPTVHVEASQHSTTLAYEAGRAGIPVAKLDADADKVTRALAAANRQQQGRIWLPRNAEWLDEWLDEHADFPSASNDDQVDTTGYAARVAGAHYATPGMSAELERAIEETTTGSAPNLMTIRL
jgi:predicted phage terminase large subunit-like protein